MLERKIKALMEGQEKKVEARNKVRKALNDILSSSNDFAFEVREGKDTEQFSLCVYECKCYRKKYKHTINKKGKVISSEKIITEEISVECYIGNLYTYLSIEEEKNRVKVDFLTRVLKGIRGVI